LDFTDFCENDYNGPQFIQRGYTLFIMRNGEGKLYKVKKFSKSQFYWLIDADWFCSSKLRSLNREQPKKCQVLLNKTVSHQIGTILKNYDKLDWPMYAVLVHHTVKGRRHTYKLRLRFDTDIEPEYDLIMSGRSKLLGMIFQQFKYKNQWYG